MPRIDENKINTKKPFKKKAYRPWNLLDDDLIALPSSENNREKEEFEISEVVIGSSESSTLETNSESIDNQLENINKSISNHYVNNNTSIGKQKTNQKHIKKEPVEEQKTTNNASISNPISNHHKAVNDNQLVTQLVTKPETIAHPLDAIQLLYGLQKKIFFYILERCIARGVLESGPITNESLKTLLNTDGDTVKTAIQRLVKKGVVNRIAGKRGKGGFTIFTITEATRNAAIEELRNINISNQIGTQLVTNAIPQLVTNWEPNKQSLNPYSNSSYINNNTTSKLPEDWQKIDFIALEHLGFSEKHLFDVYETQLNSADMVQESINHFAFGLENNPAKYESYNDPLNVLIGCLRKGKSWYESSYISPQEKAQKEFLERKKQERERIAKLQSEAYELALSDWKEKLSKAEIENIAPEKGGVGPQDIRLSIYFRENIWLKIKDEYLIN